MVQKPNLKNTPFPSSRVMTDDKLTPPESSPQNLEQSDLEIIHGYESLDPTYVSKVKILNDALREIGMGKYQVWSLTMDFDLHALFDEPHSVVVSFCCHWVWLAVVRLPIFAASCITHAFSMPPLTATTYGL
jgi:hypothetical protein